MSRRHPATPDCAISGCAKGARSFGLCAEHRDLVPFGERMQATLRMLQAQHEAGTREARKVQRLAQEAAVPLDSPPGTV